MILITGMHRSGTSFTANLTNKFGLDLGPFEKLLIPDKWNKKGYFENMDIVNLNNRMILGGHIREQYWVKPSQTRDLVEKLFIKAYKSLYLLFPKQKHFAKRAKSKKENIRALSTKYKGIGVKDPRFSLLLKYWCKYGSVDRILYCYRNPFEVASSLKKREHIPLVLGYKIWLYHVNEFLNQISSLNPKVCFLNFNNFFSIDNQSDEVKRIFNFLEKPYDHDFANRIMSQVLSRSLKHNSYHSQILPRRVDLIYRQLEEYHKFYYKPITFYP